MDKTSQAPTPVNPTVKIKDVKDTAWYSGSVKNAIAKDLMTLTDKGQFNPSLAMSVSEFQLALQKMGLKVEVIKYKISHDEIEYVTGIR